MWNMVYLITGFVFTLLLLIIFFSKKVISTKENIVFKCILVANLLEYLIEIPLQILVRTIDINDILIDIFCRFYLISITISYALFSIYVFVICFNNKKKTYEKNIRTSKIILLIIQAIFMLLLFLAPITKFYNSSKMYIEGGALDLLKLYITLQILMYIILLFINFKKLKSKKYLPIYFVILCLILMTILNSVDPSVLITSMITTFICYTMFFTIENPDLKMLEEYNKNKELTEDSIEARSNLLFKISEEVKTPVRKIKYYSDDILNTDSVEVKNKNAESISAISSNLLSNVNETLNVSYIDKKNMKLFDASYDIYNFYNQIVYIIKSKKASNVNFKYSISDAIPSKLYGDASKLKQIISSLLLNNMNKESKGIIDLDIYAIVKYDVCRLIFTIQNSLCNLSLPEINDILSSDIEVDDKTAKKLEDLDIDLKLIKKLVDILDGTLLIESSEKGTTFKVIVNQLIEEDNTNEELEKISNKLSNKKRVLLIDDDYKELNRISSELKRNNYDVTSLMYGDDAFERLSKEHYDMLMLDDEMLGGNAVELIKKIDKLDLKELVKIVMLDSGKESIKDHYVKDYSFVDYLLKDDYKDEIQRIKDKY